MSMNPGAKQPGCCGGGKKSIQQAGQQPVKQVEANDTRAQESETSSSQKPTAPQPKSKSCCG